MPAVSERMFDNVLLLQTLRLAITIIGSNDAHREIAMLRQQIRVVQRSSQHKNNIEMVKRGQLTFLQICI